MDKGGQRRAVELGRREVDVGRREAVLADQQKAVEVILAAAALRDAAADRRDALADGRDRDADLAAFLVPQGATYGSDIDSRRSAALVRLEAKRDRSAAAQDRRALSENLAGISV